MNKMILVVLGMVAAFYSTKSEACLTLPKTIALQNSPFMFSKFEMNARSVSIQDAKGRPVHFTCDRDKNNWIAEFADENGQMTKQVLTSDALSDEDEKPLRTKIQFYNARKICLPRFDGLEKCEFSRGPYFTITDLSSDKALTFHCGSEEKGNANGMPQKIDMSVAIYSGRKQISTTSVTEMTGLRGLSPTGPADGTVDLHSRDYNEIHFKGCGVSGAGYIQNKSQGVR